MSSVVRGAELAALQGEFMALLLDDERSLPVGWDRERIAIYRNNYRARLVEALQETYPRTVRWIGADSFRRAAAHHLISHPPAGWTLDEAGRGFPETLAALFANDGEVAELAWLEWAMHECFVSEDATPLDAGDFTAATVGFTDTDWADLRLFFMPGTQCAAMRYRVPELWRRLADDGEPTTTFSGGLSCAEEMGCIVWRQGYQPVCLPVAAAEGRCLSLMLAGSGFGEVVGSLVDELGEEGAVTQAGAMLGRWLHEGMIAGLAPA